MGSCKVLALSAVILLAALVTASPRVENEVDFEKVHSVEAVKGGEGRSRVRRLLNVPNQVRPFCLKIVGAIQSAPKVCESVSGFIVDATISACRESSREICKWAIGGTYGCEGIIDKICPNYETVDRKIRKYVQTHCEGTVQIVIDKFSNFASDLDKEIVCDEFVEAVRLTCRDSITSYCGNFRDAFQNPCINFLPRIVCD